MRYFVCLGTALSCTLGSAVFATDNRPNILLIVSDQHHAARLGCMGVEGLNTPNLDALAERGFICTNSYCAHPLSMPSRFSMFTGRYPADYGVRFNADMSPEKQLDYDRIAEAYPTALGALFSKAGYKTFYAGKEHLPAPEVKGVQNHVFYGFEQNITSLVREPISKEVVDFLAQYKSEDAPFFLVVSYLNPHDICEFDDYLFYDDLDEREKQSKREKIADVADQFRLARESYAYPNAEFYEKYCPALPDNFADTDPRPGGLKNRLKKYTEEQWRMYRWVYDRLIEQVDRGIGEIMGALERRNMAHNTIIIYVSDHGDMQAAHGMEQKSAPYDECQRVPLIVCGPGIQSGVVDRTSLINTGIDLLPTLCGFAGIPVPEDMPGISLCEVFRTGAALPTRRIYPSAHNWFQVTDGRYKYTLFESDRPLPEMLIDLKNEPGELKNLVTDPAYEKLRNELRSDLLENLNKRGIVPSVH